MRSCQVFRCAIGAVWVASTPQGGRVDLCSEHAADGVEAGRFRWVTPGEAVWPRSDGLERVGDFIQVAS